MDMAGEGSTDPRQGNDDLLSAIEPFLKNAKEMHEEGQPSAPPQPLPVEEYPYEDTYEIGGDSVCAIQRRLLAATKDPYPSAADIDRTRLEAQDLFEVKVKIFQKMDQWDPTGDWMGCGARALDNPRTASGEEPLGRLYNILTEIENIGPLSDVFSDLQRKVKKKK